MEKLRKVFIKKTKSGHYMTTAALIKEGEKRGLVVKEKDAQKLRESWLPTAVRQVLVLCSFSERR